MTQATAQPRRHQATLALDARATLANASAGTSGKADLLGRYSGRQLHRYDPATGRRRHAARAGDGCFALAERGGFICGMRSGYARLDRFGGDFTPLASPDYDPAKALPTMAVATVLAASGRHHAGSRATGRAASSTAGC